MNSHSMTWFDVCRIEYKDYNETERSAGLTVQQVHERAQNVVSICLHGSTLCRLVQLTAALDGC